MTLLQSSYCNSVNTSRNIFQIITTIKFNEVNLYMFSISQPFKCSIDVKKTGKRLNKTYGYYLSFETLVHSLILAYLKEQIVRKITVCILQVKKSH